MSEITKALCAFYKDVPVIHKEAKAQYGAFADLASVLSTVTPPLYKNGLVVVQGFEPGEGSPVLVTTLRHVSGESIESRLPMVIGSGRNPLHDFGGSVTYLRRYSLLAMLGLAADVDTDGELSEPSAPPPKQVPAKKAAATPVSDGDGPLEPSLKQELLETIPALPGPYVEKFCKAFATEFKTGPKRISECLSQYKHYVWSQDYFKSNPLK